jgi:hypothetical protein
MSCPSNDLYFQLGAILIAGNLILNLERVRIPEWENPKPTKVVVPATVDSQIVHSGISPNSEHILILTCMFADERCLNLLDLFVCI